MTTAELREQARETSPRAISVAWQGCYRIALSFSHADPDLLDRAVEAAELRAETLQRGWTTTHTTGGWQGVREHGAEIALVGGHPDRFTLRTDAERIATELHAAGLHCIQAELWGWAATGYEVEEWRPQPH